MNGLERENLLFCCEKLLESFRFHLLVGPGTHTKRQATRNGCLPSLLGDGDKEIEKVYGEEKNILYWAD
jgi:hypothetical protein